MELHDIIAIERACERLVRRYFYLNDARRYDELLDLFAETAQFARPTAPDQPLIGREALAASFANRPRDRSTFHVCTDVLIDVRSPTRATGQCRIVLYTGLHDGPVPAGEPINQQGPLLGGYDDEFELTDTGWKFSKRQGSLWLRG